MSLSKSFRVALLTAAPTVAIDEPKMLEEVSCVGGKMRRVNAYLATFEEGHLALRAGMQPPWFTLRPIKARELNAMVADINDPSGAELWAVAQRCLESVEGLEGFALVESDFFTDSMRSIRVLTDDAMERLAEVVGVEGVRDLGRAVLKRAQPVSRLAPFALLPG